MKFVGSFGYLPQLLSVSNVYTCFYTFFLRGGGGGVEGYIFMEKSPGFEIGKLGNDGIGYNNNKCFFHNDVIETGLSLISIKCL